MSPQPDTSVSRGRASHGRTSEMWRYFGPAFVASVAYIDPGNFVTNFEGGTRFGYQLLWVLLWSNAMAILIQYLSAKLGIATGKTLPRNCRDQYSRRTNILLWVAAELSALATDLAEFLGAALGFYLLFGPTLLAHGMHRQGILLLAALVTSVLVFAILALELIGFRSLEVAIMALVFVIGACYGVEMFLIHPDWHAIAFHVLVPQIDKRSAYIAVGMLGATVMPHVIYLHSALVQPRLRADIAAGSGDEGSRFEHLHFELIDVFAAMNGAWLVNSAMLVVAAAAFASSGLQVMSLETAHATLKPLLGPLSATVFAVALLCSGLSSSTVGTMAGQVILEGFLDVQFSIYLRRLITLVPAVLVIAFAKDPVQIMILSQVALSFTLPFALIPLLLLTGSPAIMGRFVNVRRTSVLGWITVSIVLGLNALLLWHSFSGG